MNTPTDNGDNSTRNTHSQGFVADGHQRARKGMEREIRADVEREYADRLRAASSWERLSLQRQINREIERRIDRQSPPDALY